MWSTEEGADEEPPKQDLSTCRACNPSGGSSTMVRRGLGLGWEDSRARARNVKSAQVCFFTSQELYQ